MLGSREYAVTFHLFPELPIEAAWSVQRRDQFGQDLMGIRNAALRHGAGDTAKPKKTKLHCQISFINRRPKLRSVPFKIYS